MRRLLKAFLHCSTLAPYLFGLLLPLAFACYSAAPARAQENAVRNTAPGATASPSEFPEDLQKLVQLAQMQSRDPLLKGWDYLAQLLITDGYPRQDVYALFSHPRMPSRTFIPFKLKPRESPHIYRHFFSEKKLRAARDFLYAQRRAFAAAEKAYGVPRSVVAAILLIETHFGKTTGREQVLHKLSRLASVRDPQNLHQNYQQLLVEDGTVSVAEMLARARYLEETFYPEVKALLQIAKRRKVSPHGILGSSAGAFGIPQFLPSSYLRFAVDGNGDKVISLFQEADAIASAANFLAAHGWKNPRTLEQKREVIWRYNKSDAYVDAVLGVAARLK
jgi:membrane-bound lytic murein transglycosylase B